MSKVDRQGDLLRKLVEIKGVGRGWGRIHPHYAILHVHALRTGESEKLALPLGGGANGLGSIHEFCAENGIGLVTAKRNRDLQNMVEAAVDRTTKKAETYIVADVPGWHGGSFCTPRRSYSRDGEEVVFAAGGIARRMRWSRHGSFRVWRKAVCRAGLGNPTITFMMMAAFMGPLLQLVDRPGVGFCLVGETSTGKSILLKLAGSVWGGDASGDDKHGFADTLRITPNAQELLARQARDALLVLDDTQNLPGKPADRAGVLRTLVYDLTSGGDKARLNTPGHSFSSRLVFMMASNENLEKLMHDGGVYVDESFSVRCIQIPVSGRFGIFDHLSIGESPANFANAIDAQVRDNHGHASSEFLKSLVEWRAKDEAKLRVWIGKKMQKAKDAMGIDGRDGPVARISDYFALAYAAGVLARKFKILPWGRGDMLNAVVETFAKSQAFSADRVTHFAAQGRLRRHILEHEDRFLSVRHDGEGVDEKAFDAAPGVKYRTKDWETEYLFSRRHFMGLFGQGAMLETAIKQLLDSGCLKTDGGGITSRKNQTKRRILATKSTRTRVYCVRASILNEDG